MKADVVQRQTKTGALLAHIRSLGLDKMMNPLGIRTTALAAATGVPKNSIQALLDPHVKSGALVVCKITSASGQQEREYRAGPGVPPPEFKPLTSKPGWPWPQRMKAPAEPPVPLSTPKPAAGPIEPPVFLKPTQPEVVAPAAETPAAGGRPPIRPEPAVAAKATPKPKPSAALKKEPAAVKASVGDVIQLRIDDDGTVMIATDEGLLELAPKQARKLGHFMGATCGLWNPF